MVEIRAAFRLTRLILHLASGVATATLVLPWVSIAAQRYIKARWSRQLLTMLGVKRRGGGTRPSAGLLVANHISWLDIYAINAYAPTAFVAKEEVRRWPLIGWLCTYSETIFLARGSRSAAMAAKEEAVAKLKRGTWVGFFPEGTTSHGDHVQPFHSALFQAAIDARAPVVPVALHYTDHQGAPTLTAAYVGATSLWQSLRAIVKASGLVVHVDFLPVLAPDGLDRRHLAQRSHRLIASHLARPGADRATETPAYPPAARQSGYRPTDSPNPAPADFPSA